MIFSPRQRNCFDLVLDRVFETGDILSVDASTNTIHPNQFLMVPLDTSENGGFGVWNPNTGYRLMWVSKPLVMTQRYNAKIWVAQSGWDGLIYLGTMANRGEPWTTADPDAINKSAGVPGIIEDRIRDIINDPANDITEDNWKDRVMRLVNRFQCCLRFAGTRSAQSRQSWIECGATSQPQPQVAPPPQPPAQSGDTEKAGEIEGLKDVELVGWIRETDIVVHGVGLRPNTDLYVFVEEKDMSNNVTNLGNQYAAKQEGCVRTDANGEVRFSLFLPAGSFRTGKLTIIAIDEPEGRQDDATTWAKGVFHSSALRRKYQTNIISIRPPEVQVNTTVNVQLPPPSGGFSGSIMNTGGDGGADPGEGDPLAQTFMISGEAYPNGLFVTSVDLFFAEVPGEDIPVKVELRSVVNGFPSAKDILPFSEVYVHPSSIKVPAHTDSLDDILAAKTNIKFKAPIYLAPDNEYAIVLKSASTKYRVFLSRMGQKIIGTDRTLRQQPTLGSLFKSQNARAWTPFQEEDLVFVLNRARFDISSPLVITCRNRLNLEKKQRWVNAVAVTPDVLDLSPAVEYSHTGQLKQRNTGTSSQFTMQPGAYTKLDKEHVVDWSGDFKLTTTATSTSDHVSPVIMPNTQSVNLLQNVINDLGLMAANLRITNTGSGYTSKPTITVTGGGGSGAHIEVDELRNGQVWSLKVTDPGKGYTSKPTITVTGGGGSGCQIEYDGFETDAGRGNALAKYIHRPIELVDDFAARGIRVTIDINRPVGTDVLVYVKARNEGDERDISSIPWRPVPEVGDKVFTDPGKGYIETMWELEDISYEYDGTTYTEAHEIVTKVVMVSSNTSVVPHLRDFRAVTLI